MIQSQSLSQTILFKENQTTQSIQSSQLINYMADDESDLQTFTLLQDQIRSRNIAKLRRERRMQAQCPRRKKRRASLKTSKEFKNRCFSQYEDQQILYCVLQHGPKFPLIAKLIPNRSLNMIKNRYYKYLRYRWDLIMGMQKQSIIISEYEHLNVVPDDLSTRDSQNENTDIQEDLQEIPENRGYITSMLSSLQDFMAQSRK